MFSISSRRYLPLVFLLLGTLMSKSAYAALACAITTSGTNVSFGSVSVPSDLPVGSTFGPVVTTSGVANCPANPGSRPPTWSGFYLEYYPQLRGSGVAGVWPTGRQGVGIKVISVDYDNKVLSEVTAPSHANFAEGSSGSVEALTRAFSFSYQLVKTGAVVASGPIDNVLMFNLVSHDIPLNWTSGALASYRITDTTVSTGTCGFQSNNLSIPLGNIQASTLPTPGSSSSPWVAGSLISTGCTDTTQLSMTFNGPADAENGQLFQAIGGATGIGVELRTGDDRHAQVVPNSATPLTFAPQPSGGTYPFEARYTRTTAPLNAGPGNARVTVNISYQ